MWSKLFSTVLAVSFAVMAFSAYYAWSWLGSIGIPTDAAAGYVYHVSVAWPMLWITTVGLLFLANVVFWTRSSPWALWATFVYFAIFIMIRFFWLEGMYTDLVAARFLTRETTGGIFMATVLIMIMAAIVFFDQYLITRARQKTFPANASSELAVGSQEEQTAAVPESESVPGKEAGKFN